MNENKQYDENLFEDVQYDESLFEETPFEDAEDIDPIEQTSLEDKVDEFTGDVTATYATGLGVLAGQKGLEAAREKLPEWAEKLAFEGIGGDETKSGMEIAEESRKMRLDTDKPYVTPEEVGRYALESEVKGEKVLKRPTIGQGPAATLEKKAGERIGQIVKKIDNAQPDIVKLPDLEKELDNALSGRFGKLAEPKRVKNLLLKKLVEGGETTKELVLKIPNTRLVEKGTGILDQFGNEIKKIESVTEMTELKHLLPKTMSLDELREFKRIIGKIPIDKDTFDSTVKLKILETLRKYEEKVIKQSKAAGLLSEYRDAQKKWSVAKRTSDMIDEFARSGAKAGKATERIAASGQGIKGAIYTPLTKGFKYAERISARGLDTLDKTIKKVGKIADAVPGAKMAGKALWKSLPVISALATYQEARAEGLEHEDALKKTAVIEGAESIPLLGQALQAVKSENLGAKYDTLEGKLERGEKLTNKEQEELQKRRKETWEFSKPKALDQLRKEIKTGDDLKGPVRSGSTFMNLDNESIGELADAFGEKGLYEYGSVLKNISESENSNRINAKLYGLWQRPDFRDALKTALAEARSNKNKKEK